jgi:hypothetical protein
MRNDSIMVLKAYCSSDQPQVRNQQQYQLLKEARETTRPRTTAYLPITIAELTQSMTIALVKTAEGIAKILVLS